MLTPQRCRALFVALVLSTTAIWLWNWTGRWQISGHLSSDDLIDPIDIPQSQTEPAGSFENHADLDVVNPAHETNSAAANQLQHSAVLERLFPATAMDSWMVPNREALRDLLLCLESDECRPNQRKSTSRNTTTFILAHADQDYRHSVILLSAFEFRLAWEGRNGGEEIWAAAVTLALKNLGYTYFYVSSMSAALPLYQAFPSHVRAIIANGYDSDMETPGIPLYKVLSLSFWAQPAHPFGAQWTLSPEDYNAIGHGVNTYLGYSIEATCDQHQFVPHSERSANEAYILAKLMSFFLPERTRAWSPELLNAATRATGIAYISGSHNDTKTRNWPAPQAPEPKWDAPELPGEYKNEGVRPQFEFLERLAEMRVLIGMGNPKTSPTPYDALCLGVPFINPISAWDATNPTDRSRWDSQHPPLSRLDPPYVYNVFENDLEGFVNAIKGAIENPIQSFVLESMKIKSVETRLDAIFQTDWEAHATRLGLWSDGQRTHGAKNVSIMA